MNFDKQFPSSRIWLHTMFIETLVLCYRLIKYEISYCFDDIAFMKEHDLFQLIAYFDYGF